MPNEYLLEGRTYAQPYTTPNAQAVLEVVAPSVYYADWTNVLSVDTTIASATLKTGADVWLQSINILVDSSAVTNGVSVCVVVTSGNIVTFLPASASPTAAGLRNIGAILNLTINPPYGQFVQTGGTITIFYIGSSTGSTIQLLASGIFANGIT